MRKFPGNIAAALATAAGIAFLAGCATYPPPMETITDSQVYGNRYADVWKAVLETLAGQKIEIQSSEKRSGEIVAEDRTVELRQYKPGRYDSRYCFCGSPPGNQVLKNLVGKYRISITPAFAGTTSVQIEVSYEATIFSGDQIMGQLACPSTGVFEPFFLTQVGSRVSPMMEPVLPPPREVEKSAPPPNVDWWKPTRGY